MSLNIFAKFTFSFFFIISQTAGVQENSLKQPSKPAIFKTIHTKYGDIFDCYEIHMQPSLAHPSLQNHTIQMKPSFIPEALPSQKGKNHVHLELDDGGCPEGSVPVKRVTEQDRIRLQTHLEKYPSALNPNNEQNSAWHGAGVYTKRTGIPFRGARGLLNVYNPTVTKEQHSDSLVYVQHGTGATLNAIQAGWTVFPAVYGDNHVRFHTIWTADNYKKGCIDMHCAGFVQVSKYIAPGIAVNPVSQYGGKQFALPVGIYQDQFSGNWWLVASTNVMVGYWPKYLFTGLSQYGDEAGWGGRSHGPILAPPIGSGHKPEEGFGKSCYVEEMQYVKTHQGIHEDVNGDMLSNRVDKTNHCYGVKLFMDAQDKANIFFGGPGGHCP